MSRCGMRHLLKVGLMPTQGGGANGPEKSSGAWCAISCRLDCCRREGGKGGGINPKLCRCNEGNLLCVHWTVPVPIRDTILAISIQSGPA